jgi:hypothetical protein
MRLDSTFYHLNRFVLIMRAILRDSQDVCPTRSDGSGKQGPNQEHVQGYYRKPSENCSKEKCKSAQATVE